VNNSFREAQGGFAIVEVLISAVIAVSVAAAVVSLINTAARAGTEQRHRAQAYAVAQEDQARLRALRISTLNKYTSTRTVTVGGTNYTVTSTGAFINDITGTASCGATNSTADYAKVSSTVTWPTIGATPPVVVESIIAPPNGALDPSHGGITVSAINAAALPLSGVSVTGSGTGSFSGTTDSAGCAGFPDIASGNYTLTPSAAGLVDVDGNAPASQTVSVVGGSTNTISLQYDQPGSVPIAFKYMNTSGTLVNSFSDTLVASNTGMSAPETFGTPGGTEVGTITATSLFPFTSPDTFYAGSCSGDNPNPTGMANPPGAAALANVLVPAGGTAATRTIQLPALNLTVWSGNNSSSPGSKVNAAHVTLTDDNCTLPSGAPVKRVYATNTLGSLTDPGLPWSQYDLCVDNGTRKQLINNVVVKTLTSAGTTVTVYLGSSATGILSGTCP